MAGAPACTLHSCLLAVNGLWPSPQLSGTCVPQERWREMVLLRAVSHLAGTANKVLKSVDAEAAAIHQLAPILAKVPEGERASKAKGALGTAASDEVLAGRIRGSLACQHHPGLEHVMHMTTVDHGRNHAIQAPKAVGLACLFGWHTRLSPPLRAPMCRCQGPAVGSEPPAPS